MKIDIKNKTLAELQEIQKSFPMGFISSESNSVFWVYEELKGGLKK